MPVRELTLGADGPNLPAVADAVMQLFNRIDDEATSVDDAIARWKQALDHLRAPEVGLNPAQRIAVLEDVKRRLRGMFAASPASDSRQIGARERLIDAVDAAISRERIQGEGLKTLRYAAAGAAVVVLGGIAWAVVRRRRR